jgi:hypothetical protein
VPQPDTGLLPKQLWAYQEEQQDALRADTMGRAVQRWGKLIGKGAVVEAQLADLHQCKSVLETERAMVINRTGGGGHRVIPWFSQGNKIFRESFVIDKYVCCNHVVANFIMWWSAPLYFVLRVEVVHSLNLNLDKKVWIYKGFQK